jgi:hypothetical protein
MCDRQALDQLPHTELITLLQGAARVLAAQAEPESTTDCMTQTVAMSGVIDLLEAAMCPRIGRVDSRQAARDEGFASTVGWLRADLGTRHHVARDRLRLARQQHRLPETMKRLTAGELAYGYAVTIAAGLERVDDDQVGELERILVDLATDKTSSVADVAHLGRYVNDLDADRTNRDTRPKADRRTDQRSWIELHADYDRDGAHLSGWLSNEHASLLNQALAPLAKPTDAGDPRRHSERLADALHTLLADGGRRWNATFVVHITKPRHTRQDMRGSTRERAGETGGPADSRAERMRCLHGLNFTSAHTADGYPLSPAQARRLAANAEISTLLLGHDGVPLYLGRKVRIATSAQRTAVTALYRSCAVDRCDIPAHLCEMDHVEPWESGGGTDVDILAPLCAFHNRYRHKHPNRFTITRQSTGKWRYEIIR